MGDDMIDQEVKACRQKLQRCEGPDLVKAFGEVEEVIDQLDQVLDEHRERYRKTRDEVTSGQEETRSSTGPGSPDPADRETGLPDA